jgi:hypothetical protein
LIVSDFPAVLTLFVIAPPLESNNEFPPLAPEPPIMKAPVVLPEKVRLPMFWVD